MDGRSRRLVDPAAVDTPDAHCDCVATAPPRINTARPLRRAQLQTHQPAKPSSHPDPRRAHTLRARRLPFPSPACPFRPLMASIAAGSALSFARPVKAINTNSLALSGARKGNAFLRLQPLPIRFAVCCSAKKDTVEKVCQIVKKQLAVPVDTEVCGTTKFSDLGADSLDTVEIVMGLEEEFDISVEESSAQAIATVEDAAALIDKLVADKSS